MLEQFLMHLICTGQVAARPTPLYETVSCCDPGCACPVLQHKIAKHLVFFVKKDYHVQIFLHVHTVICFYKNTNA